MDLFLFAALTITTQQQWVRRHLSSITGGVGGVDGVAKSALIVSLALPPESESEWPHRLNGIELP